MSKPKQEIIEVMIIEEDVTKPILSIRSPEVPYSPTNLFFKFAKVQPIEAVPSTASVLFADPSAGRKFNAADQRV